MSDNNKKGFFDFINTLYKDKFWGVFIKIILVALVAFMVNLIGKYLYPGQDAFLKYLINIMIGIFAYFLLEVKSLRTDNEKSNTEIVNKIYRKLISTNAIISNRDNKLAITARVLEDFPDETIYKQLPTGFHEYTFKIASESIDLVRILSYQNLLLTPKYLEYFFYRKDSVSKALRIIVLDRDQLNGKVCQATLTYVFLSARYGYETYIITEQKFKQYIQKKCDTVDKRKILKGNPFMIKTKINETETLYDGEYINYQENIENNGQNVDIKGIDNWNFLNDLKQYCLKIDSHKCTDTSYIPSLVATINKKEIS